MSISHKPKSGSLLTGTEYEASDAHAGYPVFSGARLTKSSTQSVATGTETAITFDGEDYDTDSYHDNSTNNTRLTAPATGYYMVGGSAEVLGLNVSYKYVIVRIRANGTNEDGDGRNRTHSMADAANSAFPSSPFSRVVYLAAGEYVELTLEHNAGASYNVRETTNGTSFWIYRVA
jgi:hypothetical protein